MEAANRAFDARSSANREELSDCLLSAEQRRPSLSKEDILQGLEAVSEHLGRPEWLVFRYGTFVVPAGEKRKLAFGLSQTVELGLRLRRLSRFVGFEEFVKGFGNPVQFHDACFEAKIADWCTSRQRVRDLRFAPSYLLNGHLKRPDFELDTAILGKIVCECKRAHQHEQRGTLHFQRIAKVLDQTLVAAGGVPDDFRVEVEIRGPLRGSERAFAAAVASRALRACQGGHEEDFTEGPFVVSVRRRSSPMGHAGAKLTGLTIEVGDIPVGATPEYARLAVTSDRYDRFVAKVVGGQMNKRKTSYPPITFALFSSGSQQSEWRKTPRRFGWLNLRIHTAGYLASGPIAAQSWFIGPPTPTQCGGYSASDAHGLMLVR